MRGASLRAFDTVWEDLGGSLELVTEAGPRRWEYADPRADLCMYRAQVEQFGRAVQGSDEPSASGEDGLAAAAVTEAIRRSAAEQRTVSVEC